MADSGVLAVGGAEVGQLEVSPVRFALHPPRFFSSDDTAKQSNRGDAKQSLTVPVMTLSLPWTHFAGAGSPRGLTDCTGFPTTTCESPRLGQGCTPWYHSGLHSLLFAIQHRRQKVRSGFSSAGSFCAQPSGSGRRQLCLVGSCRLERLTMFNDCLVLRLTAYAGEGPHMMSGCIIRSLGLWGYVVYYLSAKSPRASER